ncbi:hypothetical protein [Kineococcus sp. SYSU DK001]|uniref:hypothetical protein n=1 Tax=Kineococcus sp. SYSU DK001 TaxID=3383122 RepID=UPI003D7D228D
MPTRRQRHRVTVVAHRRFSPGTGATGAAGAESGLVHAETVRAADAAFARDLVLVRLHAEAALVGAAVVVDSVLVERVRWGRAPVRVLDNRRAAVVR